MKNDINQNLKIIKENCPCKAESNHCKVNGIRTIFKCENEMHSECILLDENGNLKDISFEVFSEYCNRRGSSDINDHRYKDLLKYYFEDSDEYKKDKELTYYAENKCEGNRPDDYDYDDDLCEERICHEYKMFRKAYNFIVGNVDKLNKCKYAIVLNSTRVKCCNIKNYAGNCNLENCSYYK